MAKDKRLDPVAYLDRFFDEIRDEARNNPKFADRLVKALGAEVVFDDDLKKDVINPFILASNKTRAEFYAIFSPMKPAQLRKLMREHNLATSIDVRGRSPSQLVDMLYDRATLKISERKSSYF